jgi:hypothetical protein
MGNNLTTKKEIPLIKIIDIIASKYILTQSFNDLQKLNDPNYCNKIAILTSDILASRLNSKEIEYLTQRTKEGEIINSLDREKVLFMDNNDLRKLDIKSSVKKKRMCIGIAKFYIKIAHLFSAIVSTINPSYKYRDTDGKLKNIDYYERKSYSDKNLNLTKVNLCSRRINSTIIQQLKDNSGNQLDNYEIKNNLCKLNTSVLTNPDGTKKTITKSLIEEPGIPELKQLYYDIYDYNTGKFISMSENSKKAYQYDLQLFYKTFTGNKNMPENIKQFSDIKLRDYHNKVGCKNTNPELRKVLRGKIKSSLLKKYADQLKFMTDNSKNINNQLVAILNSIFIYRIDPETNNKEISINPSLNMEQLDKLVVKARNIIVKLYLNCENDFIKLLNTFEAVVEEQIKKNTLRKIENLKQEKSRIITEL